MKTQIDYSNIYNVYFFRWFTSFCSHPHLGLERAAAWSPFVPPPPTDGAFKTTWKNVIWLIRNELNGCPTWDNGSKSAGDRGNKCGKCVGHVPRVRYDPGYPDFYDSNISTDSPPSALPVGHRLEDSSPHRAQNGIYARLNHAVNREALNMKAILIILPKMENKPQVCFICNRRC